jgi:hypothetical protein
MDPSNWAYRATQGGFGPASMWIRDPELVRYVAGVENNRLAGCYHRLSPKLRALVLFEPRKSCI